MKKIVLLSFAIVAFTFQTTAQNGMPDFNCPPGAWCHPDGYGLGGGPWEYGMGFWQQTVEGVSKVGEAMQGDPCGDKSYAEQVYCYLGEFVADVIACGYGEDTPQHELCDDDENSSSEALNSKEKKILQKVSNKYFAMSTKYRPLYFSSKNGNKAIKASLNKMKRGQTIKKYHQGYKLILGYKFFTYEDMTQYGAMMYLKNKSGKIVSTFFILSDKQKTYIVDIIDKLGNFEIQD